MLKIFGHFLPGQKLAFALLELILLGTAAYFFLVPAVLSLPEFPIVGGPAGISFLLAGIAVLIMVGTGLYNQGAGTLNLKSTAIKTLTTFSLLALISIVAGVILSHISNSDIDLSLAWYLRAAFIWFACVIVLRIAFAGLIDLSTFRRRVVVIGSGARAENVRKIGGQSFAPHFIPVAFVGSFHERTSSPSDQFTLGPESNVDDLVEFVREHRASEVVIATDDRRGLPIHQLLRCKIAGFTVTDYLSFYERECGRIDLNALQPSWLIFSDGFRTGWIVRTTKRAFDIVVSLAVLVLTLPVLLMTALLIAVESRGPILYRQERVGQFGKPFILLKFRSMRADSEANGSPQWAAKRDPRVTRVGALIRKVRIDELPQLINVLKGEMSFIGPRPERPFFVGQFSEAIPFYSERHSVKPGITGWAQINYPYGASLEDARAKLEFDLYYVKNCTLFLDFVIFIRTIRVILYPEGAR